MKCIELFGVFVVNKLQGRNGVNNSLTKDES